MSILEAQNLVKYYGDGNGIIKAVDGIGFTVEEGEFLSVTGRSGSGKSTLLYMLGGLETPSSGNVEIDGKDLYLMKRDELTVFRRKKIGFVFQNYNLLPVVNTFENIVLPLRLDRSGLDESFFNEVISLLRLENKLEDLPNHLSGGEQQRVAIARALISKPAIILADEPTGNLDSQSGNEVLKLLRLSTQRFGQTVIMITHNDSIARMSDRIITIEDGRIKREKLI
jgi:putative ABC transport system ATP-binding protein